MISNEPPQLSEKEIKKMCYLIKDETLKKYVLEDFLEKIDTNLQKKLRSHDS